jgi:threonine/homoserine/homoserine lactone efflux protein
MTSLPVSTFLAGISVGLIVAAPMGPMGLLSIERTLTSGLAAGFAVGLAAATVQVAYGVIGVLGLTAMLTALVGARVGVLSGVSGVVLVWFAFRVARRKVYGSFGGEHRRHFVRCYTDALMLGFSNPLTVPLFFAAFPALATVSDLSEGPVLIGGIFAGAVGWYLVLTTTVALLRHRLSVETLELTNKVAGLALALLGISMMASAFGLAGE